MEPYLTFDQYQKFLQFQAYQQTVPQPQIQPPIQQYPQTQPMVPMIQPQVIPQQQSIDITPVQNVHPRTSPPLKPGQANDLPTADHSSYLTGDKISIKDVVDKNIVLKGYRTMASKFRHQNNTSCNMYQFSFVQSKEQNIDDLPNNIFISGSKILAEQIERFAHLIPFYTQVHFVNNRYYSFGSADFETKNNMK